MNAFLIYVLELNLYLTLFAVTYLLFFRNEPYHRVNRWLILTSIALSAMLPLLNFGYAGEAAIRIVNLEPVLISAKANVAHTPAGFNMPSIISGIYLLGFAISLVVFTFQYMRLRKLIRGSKVIKKGAINELIAEGLNSPASFFKTILWSSNVKSETREWIQNHELVHIREKHSVDMLIVRFFEAVCWFNPVIYAFRHALEATHEFRADEVVARQHGDSTKYSEIILSQALDINPSVLAHQFSKPKLLKRRIMMLNNHTKNKGSLARYFALIPILAAAFLINACTDENTETPNNIEEEIIMKSDESVDPNATIIKQEGGLIEGTDIYATAEKMPEYPGGQGAMMTFLGENIEYPEGCKDEGVEGTVFISFVVDTDGTITDIKPLRSPDDRLSANAMKVVGKMPAWTPGEENGKTVKVMFNLPIKYQLN